MEFVPDVGHQAMLVDVRKLKQGANVVDIVDKALRMGEGHQLKKLENVAKAVNALEDEISALSDEELKGQTAKFKQRLDNGENLDKLMPEAFATVREVSKRTLGQRHFDVQLMGGAALHWGNIAEMKTGEGKTLVATLPSYLNALEGKGVHVVTVNDYLASYQSELMGRIYRFLGMNVGCIITDQKPAERRKQYNADITYGTNNEFGFDYLRDNMAWEKADLVQRGHHYAIVDEVDSILIDEARTPLIISGPAEGDVTRWYRQFARLVPKLTRDEDYEVDEKKKVVGVLDPGITKVEDFLGIDNLYEPSNTALIGYLNNAIKAKELFLRDRDYVVTHGEVLIVDEHTGRILPGRRYNEGLHQALEAKENVEIKAENQTFATITLQNYFRMYDKLAGMTGTAETEAAEFMGTYKLGVLPIPTNKPMIRKDQDDLIYRTVEAKFNAVADDIDAVLPIQDSVIDETARDNLYLDDQRNIPHRDDYLASLVATGEKTVIYVNSREHSVALARMLRRRVPQLACMIGFYNAGLSRDERKRIEELFRRDDLKVLVATSAFGEGVDIPNIRHVVLYHLPFSDVEFNQMSGRAGRDGKPAWVHLLYGRGDASINERILADTTPDHDVMAQVYRKLRSLQRNTPDDYFCVADADLAEAASDAFRAVSPTSAACGLAVFRELGLIETRTVYEAGRPHLWVRVREGASKVELTDSVRYREGIDERTLFGGFCRWALGTDEPALTVRLCHPIVPRNWPGQGH